MFFCFGFGVLIAILNLKAIVGATVGLRTCKFSILFLFVLFI